LAHQVGQSFEIAELSVEVGIEAAVEQARRLAVEAMPTAFFGMASTTWPW
jgi:hypothetical protein